jgi:hypothetical protein
MFIFYFKLISTLFESFCVWLSMKLKEKKISFWIKLEKQDNRHFLNFLWCYAFLSNNYKTSGLTDINYNKQLPVTSNILDYRSKWCFSVKKNLSDTISIVILEIDLIKFYRTYMMNQFLNDSALSIRQCLIHTRSVMFYT